jgi:hypothetical protein
MAKSQDVIRIFLIEDETLVRAALVSLIVVGKAFKQHAKPQLMRQSSRLAVSGSMLFCSRLLDVRKRTA